MRYKLLIIALLLSLPLKTITSQDTSVPEIYLLTCGPGTETYSIYGHSALRIVLPGKGTDLVYNWGVFDFDTPNFAWKFAKGKLNYMLGVYPYKRFLQDYYEEKRWVISQRCNLEAPEIDRLFQLITDNLKPENVTYRYDFTYDNCSTRIRDILEKAVGPDLLYPPEKSRKEMQTFRFLTGEYSKGFPWMKFGIDLLLGSPVDRKVSFRNSMFLPLDLKNGLSELLIRRNGKMIPLLKDPETILNFEQPHIKANLFTAPLLIFSVILILIIIITALFRTKSFNDSMDIFLFSFFSLLSLLMIFFNFFTDHQQLRWNLNILWLNPFIIICLLSLLFKIGNLNWFRLLFYLEACFLILLVFLPQHFNNAFVPLIIILLLRSSIRAGFEWNPFRLPYLTQL